MRIWILEIGEPLPLEPGVRLHRYGEFSRYLAKQPHVEVTWWTSSFSHAPKKHVVEDDDVQNWEGVELRLIRGPGYQRNVSLARIRHNQHFAARFQELADQAPRPDLIITPIPIIEAAFVASQWAAKHGIPVVVDVRDLWPQELVERAPRPFQFLAKLLLRRAYSQMSELCQRAHGIMGVSRSYRDYGLSFAQRRADDRDHVFYLGYSAQSPNPEALRQVEEKYGAEGLGEEKINICFFGTIGKFFDLETVIKAARELERRGRSVQWILCGDGSDRERVQALAADVKSIRWMGWVNAAQIRAIMKRCQVGLAPYRDGAHMALPNKPFEYMSGGLAIWSSIQEELPEFLEENQCGETYRASSSEQLIALVEQGLADPERLRVQGARGLQLFRERFTTDKVFADTLTYLQRVAGK